MKIHSMRLGLNTNSSSTHSLIFLPPGEHVVDELVDERRFGWETFTAASPEAKRDYLAYMIFANLSRELGGRVARLCAEAWSEGGKIKLDEGGYPEGDLDHQSVYQLPRARGGKGLDEAFVADLRAFLMQERLVILGGNDNGGEDSVHPLRQHGAFELPLWQDGDSQPWRARKDPLGYWVLFNQASGAKIRLSFDDISARPRRSSLPELVDLKITDLCHMGCTYCYQGSTETGKHAKKDDVQALVFALAELGIFEVALGGGEPTLYPGFFPERDDHEGGLLQTFRYHDIVPTFTTRNLRWLEHESAVDSVFSGPGGFAYSVDLPEQILKLRRALDRHVRRDCWGYDDRVSVQYVMGSSSLYYLKEIAKTAAEARLKLTLLGYKPVGRGKEFKPQPYAGWVNELRSVDIGQLSIDTPLAKESRAELDAAGVHPLFYETREGAFSMYIDAVERKVGPSSYCEESLYRPLASTHKLVDELRTRFDEYAR